MSGFISFSSQRKRRTEGRREGRKKKEEEKVRIKRKRRIYEGIEFDEEPNTMKLSIIKF